MKLLRLLGAVCLLVLLTALSRLLPTYYLVLATRILIFGIFAMSLDLLVGYAGLPSLGHAAFLGISSYAVGLLALYAPGNVALILLLGLGAALALAALFAVLALRATGVYFLMLTLALAQVVWGIAYEWRSLTGGDDGLPGIPRPTIGPWGLTDTKSFYLFTLAFFLISALALLLIVHSPFGLSLEGIRESRARMSALGYNVWLHQYLAFLLSALFAGLAGALLVWQNGIVSPAQLNVVTSAEALLMVILGGAGTMIGPLLGSATVVLLEFLVSQQTDRWMSVLGVIYILVVLFAPNGIYPPARAAVLNLFRPRHHSNQPILPAGQPAVEQPPDVVPQTNDIVLRTSEVR